MLFVATMVFDWAGTKASDAVSASSALPSRTLLLAISLLSRDVDWCVRVMSNILLDGRGISNIVVYDMSKTLGTLCSSDRRIIEMVHRS